MITLLLVTLSIVLYLLLDTTKTDKSLSAFNNVKTVNAVADFEKIKTAEVILPVIYSTVLHYAAGELRADLGEANVYYSEEAVKDPEFLESILHAPFTVGTHDKNTSEHNRDIDGWPVSSWFDETTKGALVKGRLIGESNVNYVSANKNRPKFGTSAYIDFLNLKKESGVSPDGKSYDYIATKLHCNHLAILPNPRDEHNLIIAMNSTEVSKPKTNILNAIKNTLKGKNNMTEIEIKELIRAFNAEENEAKMAKNTEERLDKIEEVLNKMAKNFDGKDEEKSETKNESEDKEDKKPEAENESKEDKDEAEMAKNAIPSQDLIASVSNSLGITFKETPSINQLAILLDVKKSTFTETLTALNAKHKELTTSVTNSNTNAEKKSVAQLLPTY